MAAERFKRVPDPHGGPVSHVHEETGVTIRRFSFMWTDNKSQFAWGVRVPGNDQKVADAWTLAEAKQAALPFIRQIEAELLEAAEGIFDGWYSDETRIDWEDFLDRLEKQTDVDLGDSLDSPLIRKIKAHIRDYRKQG